MLYTLSTKLYKPLRAGFFLFDAEVAHEMAMAALRQYSLFCPKSLSAKHWARRPELAVTAFGLRFPNPVGLAAGFDKNAVCLPAWQALGFGFVEVGTVTYHPQEGNPRPRLFRRPQEQALVNRLGFNNVGAKEVAKRVAAVRAGSRVEIPIGINIGKSRVASLEDAAKDYLASFELLADLADYVVINVSSPNTPGLRELQKEEELKKLLDAVCGGNARLKKAKPILVKIASDLPIDGAHACADVACAYGLSGLVIGNTCATPDGGLSGRPIFDRSTALLKGVAQTHAGKLELVGVGGMMDTQGAKAKIAAGAKLLQTYTGFVYGGPGFIKDVCGALK